jgi:hypothetical protein
VFEELHSLIHTFMQQAFIKAYPCAKHDLAAGDTAVVRTDTMNLQMTECTSTGTHCNSYDGAGEPKCMM